MGRVDHLFTFFTPGAVARSVAGLAAFAVRRPALFAQLLLAGLRNRTAFVRLLRLPVDADAIRNSPLFDRDWYLRNHPDLAHSGLSPELHCLLDRSTCGRWTSPFFSCDEYLSLNPAVKSSGIHPLAHYELYGRFIDAPVSARDLKPADPEFPPAAVPSERLLDRLPSKHGRTAVFATFSTDGRIPERDLFYLRALREVCDNVVLSVNSPLFPGEESKLAGVASALLCRWHGGYDFGSWRNGMRFARGQGWLEPDACRELVFANGSCYAPLRPFSGMFRTMDRRNADFWGITFNAQRTREPHLQSFFLVFRRPVLDAGALDDFFDERPLRATREEAIDLFELQLTAHLRRRGLVPDAFVRPRFPRLHVFNPTTRPIDLIRRFKVPLVKAKVFSGQSSQSPKRVLALVRKLNPELGALVRVSEPPGPRIKRDHGIN